MNPSDFMPGELSLGMLPSLSFETGVSLAIGLAAFLTVVMLGRAFIPHDPMVARIRAHAQRRAQLRAAIVAPSRRAGTRQAHVSLLRNLVDRLKLTQSEESRTSPHRLAQPPWPSP